MKNNTVTHSATCQDCLWKTGNSTVAVPPSQVEAMISNHKRLSGHRVAVKSYSQAESSERQVLTYHAD